MWQIFGIFRKQVRPTHQVGIYDTEINIWKIKFKIYRRCNKHKFFSSSSRSPKCDDWILCTPWLQHGHRSIFSTFSIVWGFLPTMHFVIQSCSTAYSTTFRIHYTAVVWRNCWSFRWKERSAQLWSNLYKLTVKLL